MRISVNVDEPLLSNALEVMLAELGYNLGDGACDTLITDKSSLITDQIKTLYVGYSAPVNKKCVYLRRPFSFEELKGALESFGVVKEDGIAVKTDKKHSEIVVFGHKILLTEKEMLLFCLLFENKNKAVSDEKILEYVWKNETVQGSNIVAVYIKYLRHKIDENVGQRLIFRVRGEGYMLKINEKE